MKLTNEMKDQIRAIAEENSYDYDMIGIRVQEIPFELGSMDHVSHIWDDGTDTGEELPGLCCTVVNSLDQIPGEYFGDHLAVIGGNRYEYGEDAGEAIISDPVVLAIIS